MTTPNFAARCGVHDEAREAAAARLEKRLAEGAVDRVRVAWFDLHGLERCKTLTVPAAARALRAGLGMVSTLVLKDSSDRTAYPVFEPGGTAGLQGFGQGNNVMLLPDPVSYRELPWAPRTGWLRSDPWFADGSPVALDARQVLERALERLARHGMGLRCGLEVEFHIYRIEDAQAQLDPARAAWPGEPPRVSMLHPGFHLLSSAWADMADEAMRIVQQTAQGLGLPLASLEIEMGPSQFEAVFDACDAMQAADDMVLFRNAVKQALRRAGYHASFACRPPFAQIMSSGWHLHQSLVALDGGANLFARPAPEPGTGPLDAGHTLSAAGCGYLAGLLAHARGMALFCTPTANGYGRYRPNALAPQSVLWGRDNRGAMLRLVGECGDPGTRLENRIGEPAANPYLYVAAQALAGLDGIERALQPPRATEAPYDPQALRLPTSLSEALQALQDDAVLVAAVGPAFVDHLLQVKRSELRRLEAAEDRQAFERTEYFSRF
jgi:glutamine synthetase